MAKINLHHIDYRHPDWKVELTGQMHRVITVIQNTKASEQQYARITNFLHSIVQEWNRMRRDLDTAHLPPKIKNRRIRRRPLVCSCPHCGNRVKVSIKTRQRSTRRGHGSRKNRKK